MRYQYDLRRADWRVASGVAARLLSTRRDGMSGFWLNLVAWAFIGAGLAAVLDTSRGRVEDAAKALGCPLLAFGFGMLASLAVWFYAARRARSALEAAVEPFPIETEVGLDADGLISDSRFGRAHVPWAAIEDVRVLPEHVAVVLRPCQVLLVPNRAFPDPAERDEFVRKIREGLVRQAQ